MSTNATAFCNPASVVLTIEPDLPMAGEDILTYPERLPGLPQVGHIISLTVAGRDCRYIAKVADVVFVMDLEDGTGECSTSQVEIRCSLMERQSLP